MSIASSVSAKITHTLAMAVVGGLLITSQAFAYGTCSANANHIDGVGGPGDVCDIGGVHGKCGDASAYGQCIKTPEMSDYLAMLFVVIAGGMVYHTRRRALATA